MAAMPMEMDTVQLPIRTNDVRIVIVEARILHVMVFTIDLGVESIF